MKCKFCGDTMTLEGNGEYACDNCGATYDSQDDAWTEPVVPPAHRNPTDDSDECAVDSDGCLIDNDGDAETDMEDRL